MSLESRQSLFPASAPHDAGRRGRAVLYGFGRDGDGQVRITTGPGYCLAGGDSDTHDRMWARARRFLVEVERLGYNLDNITREEAAEIARLVEEPE